MANELILIIEDNEANRVFVRDMLRFKGYRTLEAQSAEEGICVAQEKKPALILMDFHLPKMNGIEALQALRADAETQSIRWTLVQWKGITGVLLFSLAWGRSGGTRAY